MFVVSCPPLPGVLRLQATVRRADPVPAGALRARVPRDVRAPRRAVHGDGRPKGRHGDAQLLPRAQVSGDPADHPFSLSFPGVLGRFKSITAMERG